MKRFGVDDVCFLGYRDHRTIFLTNLAVPLLAPLLEQSFPVRQIGEVAQKGSFERSQPRVRHDPSNDEEADETACEQEDGARNSSNTLHPRPIHQAENLPCMMKVLASFLLCANFQARPAYCKNPEAQ